MPARKIVNRSFFIVNRLIISFFAFIFLLTITSYLLPIAHAQAPIPSALPTLTPVPYTLPPNVSPISPLYTDLLVNNLFHSFSCLAIGQSLIGQPCLTYQVTKNAQGVLQGIPVLSQTNLSGGALGATTSIIGALYQNPPVRTADYLASVGQGLGIVKTANAQVVGSGAQVLSPILKLWQVSRNISYVFLIIIFLVIGLMVMFRNRLNPQTVITAQTALPGLVIGLIMITFSYFFAGLISDMAFVGTNIVGYYFSAVQEKPSQNLVDDMQKQNILSIFSPLTSILNQDNVSHALDSIWPSLERKNRQEWNPLDFDPSRVITALAGMMMTQLVMPFASMFGPIGSIIGGVVTFGAVASKPTAIAGFALAFIAMVILIYSMLKLLLRLINNYLTIIFLTFSAPFQFLFASLPGRQGITTNWIMNMLANILAFPAVLAVLYFVAFLIGPEFIKEYYPNCRDISQPCVFRISQLNQIVDKSTFPLFGGLELDFIRLILAFGALVALPSIPDILGRTIGRMSQAGQMLGQEISGGIGQGQRYAGQFQSGVGGLTGRVGQVTDIKGWEWDATLNGGKGGWKSSTTAISGARPGFGGKVRGWFR